MPDSNEIKKVEQVEEKILEETDRIDQAEKRIDREEKVILESERKIISSIDKHPLTALVPGGMNQRELGYFRSIFTRRAAKHKTLVTILAAVGAIMVSYGIWQVLETTPFLSIPLVSIIIGALILWILKRLTNLR